MGLETALLLGSLGLMGAGTGMQMSAASSEKDAMNSAVNDELARQEQYKKQGQAELANSIQNQSANSFGKDITQGQQEAKNEYDKLQSVPLLQNNTPTAGSSPTENKIVGEQAAAKNTMGNTAAAGMKGYDEAGVQSWINNLKSNTEIGQTGQFARNSEAVLPSEIQAAQQSEQGLAGAGSLVSTLGSVLGLANAVGAFAPAAAASAPVSSSAMEAMNAGFGPVSNAFGSALASSGGGSLLGVMGAPTFGRLATAALPNYYALPSIW